MLFRSYSIESTQCGSFATAGYSNEGVAFYAAGTSVNGVCASNTVPVSRYVRTLSGVTFERYSTATDPKFTDFTKVATPAFCVPQ